MSLATEKKYINSLTLSPKIKQTWDSSIYLVVKRKFQKQMIRLHLKIHSRSKPDELEEVGYTKIEIARRSK